MTSQDKRNLFDLFLECFHLVVVTSDAAFFVGGVQPDALEGIQVPDNGICAPSLPQVRKYMYERGACGVGGSRLCELLVQGGVYDENPADLKTLMCHQPLRWSSCAERDLSFSSRTEADQQVVDVGRVGRMLGDPVLHLDRGPSRGSHSQRCRRAPTSFGLKKPVVALTLGCRLEVRRRGTSQAVHQSLIPK